MAISQPRSVSEQMGVVQSPMAAGDLEAESAKGQLQRPAKIKLSWLLLILVLILVLAGGALFSLSFFQKHLDKSTTVVEPTVQRIAQAGKLVVGTDATFPPMELVDEKGQFLGYDIDLANRIGEKLQVQIELKNIGWDDIFKALDTKEVDVVISSMTITDERKQTYDFSDSYLNAGQVIITRKDDSSINSTADLGGKRIAVQVGTTNEQQARKYTSNDLVLPYDDFMLATGALKRGEADAIFSDLTGAKGIVTAHKELKIASDPFTSENYGIMFRKGEEDLVEKVNQALNSLRQQGVLVYLKQKWLE